MRVIAGTFGGRTLRARDLPELRPTTDRVRESIFSILFSRFDVEGGAVLDLFAGTGALGIEAISRGAARCTFVEKHRKTAALVEENLASLGITEGARVVVRDAVKFLEETDREYDLILADPPYAATVFDRVIALVFERGLLRPGGFFVLEHSSAMRGRAAAGAEIVVERSFGDTAITIYRRTPVPDVPGSSGGAAASDG